MCSEELKEQWETRVAQERASVDEKQAKEIQVKFHYIFYTKAAFYNSKNCCGF